jgi:hypothetical protein
MNWKEYEKEIHEYFRSQFPNADISHNVIIKGRYSKVNRQIDILIEDYIAGNRIRIIIDGKFFAKKIDVKDVEMFIGMLNDCEANKGLLITQQGYSKAAINRAYHDPIDIELDIYNFKELHDFQGFMAIPFCDGHGVILAAPFGWIVDNTRRENILVTLYQRGLTLEDAQETKEWMYANIKSKDDKIRTLKDLTDFQDADITKHFPDAKIYYLPTVKRNDVVIKLRSIEIISYQTTEYTGFVEFEDFIFFCVMYSPEKITKRNIRKLESILTQVLNIKVIENSFEWSIQSGKRGTMMFLDVVYFRKSATNEEEYLTLTIAKDYSQARPEFISIIVPNDIKEESGINLTFGKTQLDENEQRELKIDSKSSYHIDYEDCNDEFCTARILNGYISRYQENNLDFFQKLLDNDHLFVEFEYPNGSRKSVAIPLFSFKNQYSTLE